MFDLVEEPRMDALYAITYSNDAFPQKNCLSNTIRIHLQVICLLPISCIDFMIE